MIPVTLPKDIMEHTAELLKVDTVLASGRYYPRAEVERAIEQTAPLIDQGWFGEPDTSLELSTDLGRISHKVKRVWLEEDGRVMATIQVLPKLPMGSVVETLLRENLNLGLSVRATGMVGSDGSVSELEFHAIDMCP